jgi:hypothetical protein
VHVQQKVQARSAPARARCAPAPLLLSPADADYHFRHYDVFAVPHLLIRC